MNRMATKPYILLKKIGYVCENKLVHFLAQLVELQMSKHFKTQRRTAGLDKFQIMKILQQGPRFKINPIYPSSLSTDSWIQDSGQMSWTGACLASWWLRDPSKYILSLKSEGTRKQISLPAGPALGNQKQTAALGRPCSWEFMVIFVVPSINFQIWFCGFIDRWTFLWHQGGRDDWLESENFFNVGEIWRNFLYVEAHKRIIFPGGFQVLFSNVMECNWITLPTLFVKMVFFFVS